MVLGKEREAPRCFDVKGSSCPLRCSANAKGQVIVTVSIGA